MSLESRLLALPGALSAPDFVAGRGLGNEIGFYIFDYPPAREPDVDRAVRRAAQAVEATGTRVVVIDLYRTMLDLLAERGYLDRALDLERHRGEAALRAALTPLLSPEKIAQAVARQAQEAQLVLLTGVGAAYPTVRSHSVLNNLHQRLDRVPVVMFFPGEYDGQVLRLFGLLKDDNYYRAFRLLPDSHRGASL